MKNNHIKNRLMVLGAATVIGLDLSMPLMAQGLQPQVEIKSAAVASTGPLTSMWLTANQWGMYREGAMVYAKVSDTLYRAKDFHLNAGLGGVLNFPANESFMHEGYLSGKLFFVDFSLGLNAFSPTSIDDGLTSGMFLGSSNARPIPRVSVGIYRFTDVPLTSGWLQVKGGISQGYVDDYPAQSRGHQDVFLHEKFAYFRLSHWKVKPYMGLIHSALFGGKGIKTDFWSTFFAQGSEKLGGGEATNAAGAHMGLYDFGVDYEFNGWNMKLYLQKPFGDGSGLRLNAGNNRDYICGIWLQNGSGGKIIKGVSAEVIKTTYQSGPGFPDPYDAELVDPDNPSVVGVYFWPGSMDDPAAFMAKYYPDVPSDGWDKYDITAWLEGKVNHGHHFGGRDDYMNNGMYYSGWTYHGRSTGTPLFHTADQVRAYAPGWVFRDEGTYFVNNRIKGLHVGVEGQLCTIEYRLKMTYTKNYGSYSREYEGRWSWTKTDDYFYREGLNQFYFGLDMNKPVTPSKRTNVFVSLGLDSGQLYESWGAKAGLAITLR
ncbi:MAG: capsule assembly Wzi family protein [Breznakibacter sp.]